MKCTHCRSYFDRNDAFTDSRIGRMCSQACHEEHREEQNAKRRARAQEKQRKTPDGPKRSGRKKAFADPEYAVIRKAVRERDGHRCRWCGRPGEDLEVHHVKYRSQGGADHASNLITLCQVHHREAHSCKWLWQPVLLATIWLHYAGQRLLVPEVHRRLEANGIAPQRPLDLT